MLTALAAWLLAAVCLLSGVALAVDTARLLADRADPRGPDPVVAATALVLIVAVGPSLIILGTLLAPVA